MKVFTVGLDEKPPLKEHPEPETVTVVPPPMIAVEKKIKKSYKGYMICFATMFFVLFFAIILSEIAYNRARDESFLRLRWAELRHRMGMGCSECNHQRIAQALYRQNRLDSSPLDASPEVIAPKATTPALPPVQPIDDTPKERTVDPRFEFLRQILTKIREQAEKAGIDGTVRVSVIRIDPMEENQDSSFMDGFGEVQQPQQFGSPFDYQAARQTDRMFGPWPVDYYNNEDNSPQVIEILANRRTEMGPQMNGQGMEIFPMVPNVMDSSNGWSNQILPWAGTINQGQKTFETYQPIQQPDYVNIQQWPANTYQPDQWQTFQPQQPQVQANQWYTPDNQWQSQNPLWQWQGNQWQPIPNPWNQWQNGIQVNNQQPQTTFQWPAQQQAVNTVQDDNRWQASLQNNQWTVQRANAVDNNQIAQASVAPAVQWWNTDNKWNNQIVQPQPDAQASNAIPVIQQQPVLTWNQQTDLPWTHVPQKVNEAAQTEQRVILASVENNNDKPIVTVPDEQAVPVIPQQIPFVVEPQVPEIPVIPPQPEIVPPMLEQPEIVPVVQQQPEVVPVVQQPEVEQIKEVELVPEVPKVEVEPKPEPAGQVEEKPKAHIHDLPELELAYQNQQALPFDDSEPEPEPKIDFPAVKFPVEPLNEANEDVNSHIFFQVDEPQPQFGEPEAFVAK